MIRRSLSQSLEANTNHPSVCSELVQNIRTLLSNHSQKTERTKEKKMLKFMVCRPYERDCLE